MNRPLRSLLLPVFLVAAFAISTMSNARAVAPAHTFTVGDSAFQLDGKPFVIRCGEIHFARVPREYWRHRLQLCRAMGLNTVCVYLFWNFHEWEQGKFDWSGQADVAEFCRIAQEEGLWVLLRPGPYSCAEWEMGGLPWWLLKNDGIALRSTDPKFMAPAQRYLREVGRVLGPLQITHGGPLLMVQVENEYGSFGKDPAYMGALRQALVDAGFDVPLFACNPAKDIPNGRRDDLFQVVNFGKDPAKAFAALRQYQATGPLMCGEYYPGWFDVWGRAHATATPDQAVADLGAMLGQGASFSIYMVHGGTSFGLWSGADHPFKPDTSSYDYDAPISEAGWVTPKFTRLRTLFAARLQPGEILPALPAANPVIAVAPFAFTDFAPLFANLPAAAVTHDARPRAMELFDQSRGCTVYRTTVPAGPAAVLRVKAVHDYGWVLLDGQPVGAMDRRSQRYTVELPARTKPAQLNILVEAVGRVNFGAEIFDRKGLIAPVELTAKSPAGPATAVELTDWSAFALPLDATELAALKYQPAPAGSASVPAFWRSAFDVKTPGDTFLDVRGWGKGVVWVNGHCLGRFWNIGPTQSMYCPGPWLRAGRNEIVVLDLLGPSEPKVAGLMQPILDELHPEKDFVQPPVVMK